MSTVEQSIYCECGEPKASPKLLCCNRCGLLDGIHPGPRGPYYSAYDIVSTVRTNTEGIDIHEICLQTGRLHRSVLRTLQKLQHKGRIVRRLETDESATRPRALYYLTLPKGMN